MGDFADQFFWVFFAAFLAYFAYSVFTKHGKGRMFGGEIVKTLEPQIAKTKGMVTTKIKVHVIKPSERLHERDIGIEFSHSAIMGWSMTPITLTAAEALQLKSLIEEGLSERWRGT
jgi:hypothetical protein